MNEKDQDKFQNDAMKLSNAIVENLQKMGIPFNTSAYTIILALCRMHALGNIPIEHTIKSLKKEGEAQIELFKSYYKQKDND